MDAFQELDIRAVFLPRKTQTSEYPWSWRLVIRFIETRRFRIGFSQKKGSCLLPRGELVGVIICHNVIFLLTFMSVFGNCSVLEMVLADHDDLTLSINQFTNLRAML